jgi:hypothetical protein
MHGCPAAFYYTRQRERASRRIERSTDEAKQKTFGRSRIVLEGGNNVR